MDNNINKKEKMLRYSIIAVLIANILTACIMYFNLPEQIPIQWNGIEVSKYANKEFIFLLPVIAVFFYCRPIMSNFLFRLFGQVDNILINYANLSIQLLMLTCVIYTIAYCYGLRWRISYILIIEFLVLIVGFLRLYVRKN